jgi:hypothetical protein
VTGDEVRDTWLLDAGSWWASGEGSRTGYRASEVDDLLRRVAAELDAGRPAGPLIENTAFRSRGGKKGYDVEAVDWFLEQFLLPQDHIEPGEASTNPWHGVGDVTQLVLGGVSGLARRYPPPQKPTRREVQSWFTGQCENAWRDFGEQPGVQLRCEQAQVPGGLWELRTAGQQILVSLEFAGPIRTRLITSDVPSTRAISAGGRRFTFQTVDRARSSSPVIAEIAARAAQDAAGHFAKPAHGRPPSVRGLVDEAGTPILYISGRNIYRRALFCVSFPDGQWLRFPVRGTNAENAIMTAVNQAGNKAARYRMNGKRFEITVNPGQHLTDELAIAMAISARRVKGYFITPD